MRRTYITVSGKVKEYSYDKTKLKGSKRAKCPRCGEIMSALSVVDAINSDRKTFKLGYYCPWCRASFMDKKMSKILSCEVTEGGR